MSSIDSTANIPKSEPDPNTWAKDALKSSLWSLGRDILFLLALAYSITELTQSYLVAYAGHPSYSPSDGMHHMLIIVLAANAAGIIAFRCLRCPSMMDFRTYEILRWVIAACIVILGFVASEPGAFFPQLLLVIIMAAPLGGKIANAWDSWDAYRNAK
jgi:uncharacterized membrane protein YbhN (UPF0104 family)